jgi:hypothetical protein
MTSEADWSILVPFDAREAMTLRQAALRANKSESTMRSWCIERGLGRRVGDGPWNVSRVALAMFLDGDINALRAYHAGDRSSPLVTQYFERSGLSTLCRIKA